MATSRRRARRASEETATRLMALSGAVIVAVYAVGYSHTEAAARRAATPPPAAVAAQTSGPAGQASQTSGVANSSVSSATPATAGSQAGASKTGAASGKYRSGTYSAQGWGPHGPVTVAVVVRGGRIVSANVTVCGTTYPCNYLSPLVSEVVQNQGPPTDYVSGATASSEAYYEAVTQALAKA